LTTTAGRFGNLASIRPIQTAFLQFLTMEIVAGRGQESTRQPVSVNHGDRPNGRKLTRHGLFPFRQETWRPPAGHFRSIRAGAGKIAAIPCTLRLKRPV
jgi:hypothetical protein